MSEWYLCGPGSFNLTPANGDGGIFTVSNPVISGENNARAQRIQDAAVRSADLRFTGSAPAFAA